MNFTYFNSIPQHFCIKVETYYFYNGKYLRIQDKNKTFRTFLPLKR